MTGARMKMAGKPGANWVTPPAISREQAGRTMGQEIPLAAWHRIEKAVETLGKETDALHATKASRKKGDPKGWLVRQTATTKALEAALDRLGRARYQHESFLSEASENYSLQTRGHSAGPDVSARRMVEAAIKATKDALIIVARAKPQNLEEPTVASARSAAVRDIQSALMDHGIKALASTGFGLDALDPDPVFKDLTPFEHLIAALLIGDENTRGQDRQASAFSAFIREAIAEGKRE